MHSMNEPKFKVGDLVNHKEVKKGPTHIMVRKNILGAQARLKDALRIIDNISESDPDHIQTQRTSEAVSEIANALEHIKYLIGNI